MAWPKGSRRNRLLDPSGPPRKDQGALSDLLDRSTNLLIRTFTGKVDAEEAKTAD